MNELELRNKTKVRAVFIDDVAQDLRYADRLTQAGLPCLALKPPPTIDELLRLLAQSLREDAYDVVLLDYRLDDEFNDVTGGTNYRGGTVAATLKELHPDIPLVLVTHESKLRRWLLHNPRVRRLFDYQVLKEDLNQASEREGIAQRIEDLALSYHTIASATARSADQDPWEIVADLMAASPSERDTLSSSYAGPTPRTTNEIADWLLHEVIKYPGFLLDERETAVRLGVTASSFRESGVQSWLESAMYSGVFSKLGHRWWRGRIADLLFEAAGVDSFGTSEQRVEAIARRTGLSDLIADRCVWCDGGAIARSCSVCSQAVDSAHHLVGRVDERPRWAEPFVVCFRCIQEGREEEEEIQYAPGTSQLVQDLKTGNLLPPEAND